MARKKTKRLRYEDRVIIERMSKAGKKVADIANEIGVHRDTIYKEFTRCGATKETYSADGTYTGWYNKVYEPVAATSEVAQTAETKK